MTTVPSSRKERKTDQHRTTDVSAYACKLGQPWSLVVEGLINLGARVSGVRPLQASRRGRWSVAFDLPVEGAGDRDLNCMFHFTAPMTQGDPPPTDVTVRVGSANGRTTRLAGRTQAEVVHCLAHAGEIDKGRLSITMTAEQAQDGTSPSDANPLPYMLQAIVVTELATAEAGEELTFRPDHPGAAALIEGFAPPQVEGLAWSIKRNARIIVRLGNSLRPSPTAASQLSASGSRHSNFACRPCWSRTRSSSRRSSCRWMAKWLRSS